MPSPRRTLLLGFLLAGCDSSPPYESIDASAIDASPIDGTLPPCSTNPSSFTKMSDLAYATTSNAQKVDLYIPDGAGPYPVVVFIHGGGWQGGDKVPGDTRQATRGYVVASMNYRLSGEAIFPAQIHDVKAAIRWLRASASRYKIDPARVAVFGPSAGGHLAALAGTSGGVAALEDASLGNAGESSIVQAVVDHYGPSDFLQMDPNIPATCTNPLMHSTASSPESRLLGCEIETCPDRVASANPITYVSADDPPFLIRHGTDDCTVPPHQSQLIRDALVQQGVPATLDLIANAGHGGPTFNDAAHSAILDQFFDDGLKACR